MSGFMNEAVSLLEAQQAKVKPRSPQWMVGEQLKDICRREPESAKLLARDLRVKDMDITAAEKKIKAFADGHKTGSFSCVTPAEADRIQKELNELKAKPVDVAVEVKEPTPEELEKLTAQAVEKARAEDAARLADLEKQLAGADGDMAAFRVHYEAWQEHFNKLSGYLAKISGRDQERAGKLRMAVKAAVERMAEG